jgi:membrane protease YdiL (CAAX protease family)
MAGRVPPWVWLLAAFVPVAVNLGWRTLPFPTPAALADCGSLTSAPALWRVAQAIAVLGSLAVVARMLAADRASLSLRWPSRPVIVASVAFAAVVAPLALWLGPILAVPFFGQIRLETGILAAVVPAVVLALANGLMEEVTFRGALMGWGARLLGPSGALVFQAIVFGLVHVGPDFTGNPLPVVVAVGVGGLMAGLIVRRTGSLLLPIAVHAAFDVPLYYVQACRLS